MKAMILAAGFGTRLKPLTDHKPKALIEINGTPMLELLIRRLINFGIKDIIINVHHLAEMIIAFVRNKADFGINIQFSIEKEILGTGGGIKKAAHFFADGKPFLVHNVDIMSAVDFNKIFQYHLEKGNLATLAVMRRSTDRYFIVDQNNLICGHLDEKKKIERLVKKARGETKLLAFSGIHLISPQIFNHIMEEGHFSIVDIYLQLIAAGYPIGVYQMELSSWKDLGKIENLNEVEVQE